MSDSIKVLPPSILVYADQKEVFEIRLVSGYQEDKEEVDSTQFHECDVPVWNSDQKDADAISPHPPAGYKTQTHLLEQFQMSQPAEVKEAYDHMKVNIVLTSQAFRMEMNRQLAAGKIVPACQMSGPTGNDKAEWMGHPVTFEYSEV